MKKNEELTGSIESLSVYLIAVGSFRRPDAYQQKNLLDCPI